MKPKKCKQCKDSFIPLRPLQQVCCIYCGIMYNDALKRKREAKKWQSEKSALKESLMTHKDYLKLLQITFNTYIRMRDKGKPCISCGKVITGKTDAGHFYSVGGYPALRFNEDNVHSQCINCNQYNHGNIHEYTLNLPKRIGQERFDYLVSIRESVMKYSIDELKEMLKIYKKKIAELK